MVDDNDELLLVMQRNDVRKKVTHTPTTTRTWKDGDGDKDLDPKIKLRMYLCVGNARFLLVLSIVELSGTTGSTGFRSWTPLTK